MTATIVVDASAVVEVLRRSERGDRVAQAMRHATPVTPAHMDAEVLSALGRMARADVEEDEAVRAALALLQRLPVARLPIAPLLDRAWDLRHNIALRDGLYVACAAGIGAALLTLDARLARAAPVEVVPIPR